LLKKSIVYNSNIKKKNLLGEILQFLNKIKKIMNIGLVGSGTFNPPPLDITVKMECNICIYNWYQRLII